MESPDLYLLSNVEWQFWCTFTFQREVSDCVQASMLHAWMRELSSYGRVLPTKLLWVCRRELGEINGRRHFHALVAGLPSWAVTQGVCWRQMRTWNKRLKGGSARVYLFERALSGVEYTLKQLDRDGAQLYECRKFGSRSTVTLSNGLLALLSQKRARKQGSGQPLGDRHADLGALTDESANKAPSLRTEAFTPATQMMRP